MKRYAAGTLLLALVVGMVAACGTTEPAPTAPPASGPVPTPTPITSAPGADPVEPEPVPTEEQPLADFADKTITFLVGFPPGGGYDIAARLLGLYMPKYLPGQPRVVIQNLPGAGGLRGLQALVRADPDGLSLGYAHPRWINQDIMYGDVDGFTIDDIIPVGVPTGGITSTTYFGRASVVSSFEELMQSPTPLLMGQTEPVGPGYPSNNVFESLGVPLRVLYGYGGGAEIAAALDRGELQVGQRIVSFRQFYPEWIAIPAPWVPLFYIRAHPTDDPEVMDYLRSTGQEDNIPPHLYDAVGADDQMREFMDLGIRMFESTGRLVVLPAGTPDHIVSTLRQAFRDAVEDPGFVEALAATGNQASWGDPAEIDELLDLTRVLLATQENLDIFLALGD